MSAKQTKDVVSRLLEDRVPCFNQISPGSIKIKKFRRLTISLSDIN